MTKELFNDKPIKYRAFFDKNLVNVEGFFTVQDDQGNSVFKRLSARSGQKGYTRSEWIRGKSPIPQGEYLLWLKPINPGADAGKTGIGEFYPISNQKDNKRLIKGPKNYNRYDIGLHPENAYVGSAGCVVLVNETTKQKTAMKELFKFLKELGQTEDYIHLTVL